MRYCIQFLLIGGIFISACSEKDPVYENKMELITSATWKFDRAGLDINKDEFIDTDVPPGYIMDCDEDNTLTFRNDGTGTLDEGTVKCDPANPQTSVFNWSFKNGETVINFPTALVTGFDGDIAIRKLTSTQLFLNKEISIGGTGTVNVILEMKH